MDIHLEKLSAIERLLKVENESLIRKIHLLLDWAESSPDKLSPMTIDEFLARIEASEAAIKQGDVKSYEEMKEEVKTWRKS